MANRNENERRGRGRWQGFDLGGGSGQSGRNPWRFSIFYVIAALLLILITVFVWRSARQWPYLVTGWFWYVGTLLPVIGLLRRLFIFDPHRGCGCISFRVDRSLR